MIKTCSYWVCALCVVFAMGCKKKPSGTAPAAGSGSGPGSAMAGSGSSMAGSDTAGSGSGSAMAGSGSAGAGSAGSDGSAAAAGSGSADTGSGSAGAGSAAGSGSSAQAEDPEGKRHWNCKKACKLALHCKSSAGYHNAKECDLDCANLAKDKDGRYARGSVESAAFYTCLDKATGCAAVTACGHH